MVKALDNRPNLRYNTNKEQATKYHCSLRSAPCCYHPANKLITRHQLYRITVIKPDNQSKKPP